MSAPAVIRFPPPPPTRNELSSQQRAKLIRTNNKLGQVLGSTPHVLDLSYIVPSELPAPPKTPTSSKNPFRGHSRKKSSPKADMDAMRADMRSPDSVASTASRKSTSSVRMKTDELAWRTPYSVQRPPLLQLSVPSNPSPSRRPRLDTIPGSPPYDDEQLSVPVEPPTFYIPSDAAVRREKMRRVRKMLGDGVPHDLVFPSSPGESDSDSEEDSPLVTTPTSTMSREWLLVDTNKPLPTPGSEPLPVELSKKAHSKEMARRDRLHKERPKDRPSKGVRRLESIAESTKESKETGFTVVGVSASAGMGGRGKSRRFIKGDVPFDQIGTAWGGHMW